MLLGMKCVFGSFRNISFMNILRDNMIIFMSDSVSGSNTYFVGMQNQNQLVSS